MLAVPLNDLSRFSDAELKEYGHLFADVLRSGQFLKGRFTTALEDQLSDLFGGRAPVAVANGTDALIIALLSLGLKEGDCIALAPNAGGYASIAARVVGLTTVFVDVDILTAQMSGKALQEALRSSPEIRAVIVTHLYGMCSSAPEIADICKRSGVKLIEDCAQSFGAGIAGRLAGDFGDITTLSFYPTKNLAALGDGGALLCRDSQHAHLARQFAQYGWSKKYQVEVDHGFNSRLDEVQAAILIRRLHDVPRLNLIRRNIVHRYQLSLSAPRRMIWSPGDEFVAHLAIMVTPDRNRDSEYLRSQGIESGVHYPLLDFEQPAWQQSKDSEWYGRCPNALWLVRHILTLPSFPQMTEEEITHVTQTLEQL